MVDVKIQGIKSLSRELKKLSDELPKELKKIGKDAAEIVAVEARGIVPVLSGRLRNKIKAGATTKGGDVRVSGLPYANPIHFGWRKHNIRPNPFLYNALDSRTAEVIEAYSRGIGDLLEKTFTNSTD